MAMRADVLQTHRAPTCKQALHVGANGPSVRRLITKLSGRTIEFRSKVRAELRGPSAVEQHFVEATQAAKRIAAEKKKPKGKGGGA